jgi:prolyl oligopeptidase
MKHVRNSFGRQGLRGYACLAGLLWWGSVLAQALPDPYIGMENLQDPNATRWVDEQSVRTLETVRKMPGFEERYKANLRILSQREFNIQFPSSSDGLVYNHFRTAGQPKGVWRRATMDEYRKERPEWQTLLNLDSYNRGEPVDWTWAGAQVQPAVLQDPKRRSVRALVRLTRGGSDAAVVREFDLNSRSFVASGAGGFEIPEAKGWAYWWSADELLVSTDFGPGSMTDSGYPRELRLWKRGTLLSSAAPLFRAEATDMSVDWWTDIAPDGSKRLLVKRRISFFKYAYFAWDGKELKALDLPAESTVRAHGGYLLIEPHAAWVHKDRHYAAGSLLLVNYEEFIQGHRMPRVLFEAGERKTRQGYVVTENHVAVNELRDLQSRVVIHDLLGDRPPREVQGLPDFGLARLWQLDATGDAVWLSFQGFLEPQSLYVLNTASLALDKIQVQGPVADANPYRVERGNARSPDGTLVPYTLIQRKDAPRDGRQPTLLYGYGGFGISVLPEYQRFPLLNWLGYGGTYVIAHIRGGGEFGPAWTQAAKGIRRQTGFDDFAAVAQALVDARVTQPSQLGIYGASNGGLLVSAVMVQRPELFGAVVSRVPLTDMRRYTRLLAGPSWVEEYGDPDKAEDWAVLSRYSPYENLRPGLPLPPTLFITNRNDDRVHPAHGRKMAAKQQAMGYPAWLYEPREGGHSGVATPQLQAEREALLYTFLMHNLQGNSAPK